MNSLRNPLQLSLARHTAVRPLATLILTLLTCCRATAALAVEPLPQAHAHNDYEHTRPLLDALDNGFTSVEADIYLVDGQLLVAHNRRDVKPERTLEALYLDPLLTRTKANGGRVYRDGPPFTLLVDIKADGVRTYDVLAEKLGHYAEMLTEVRDDQVRPGAVTVIISGDRPFDRIQQDKVRYVGIDGRMSDLGSDQSVALLPLLSDNWGQHFRWRGQGEMPEAEREKLHSFVKQAHAKGRKIRFWAIPSTPATWRELADAGVDLINTDDLPGLAQFLRERKTK